MGQRRSLHLLTPRTHSRVSSPFLCHAELQLWTLCTALVADVREVFVLVDADVDCKELARRMKEYGVCAACARMVVLLVVWLERGVHVRVWVLQGRFWRSNEFTAPATDKL